MISQVPDVGRVVVGASGSPGSVCALRCALSLARANAAPLSAVIAWVPPDGDLAERRFPSPALRRTWADAARQRLLHALEDACGSATPDVGLSLVIVRGDPGRCLVDVADRSDDLLVVGAGRRGLLARMWHGRVSRYCLSHARCPVLAVPGPATPRQMGLGRVCRVLRRRELTADQIVRDASRAA